MTNPSVTMHGASYLTGIWKPGQAQPKTGVTAPKAEAPQIRESVDLSTISATPEKVDTKSGIHAEYHRSSLGTAFKAALPAGPLLPAPILLESIQNQAGTQVQAFATKGDEKIPLKASAGPDGRMYVQLDSSPNSPLMMFDPGNMDFGLVGVSQTREDGSTHRNLSETVHADGSRSMVQNHTIARDGSQTFNQVYIDPQGQARGGAVQIDSRGERSWTDMPTTIDERGVRMQGQTEAPARSLLDHTLDSIKNPFSFKSPFLSWMKEKKQAARAASTMFASFSHASANSPGRLFPNLMEMLHPGSAPSAASSVQSAAPVSATNRPVKVLQGDITQIPADGILTTVNSGGMWFGGVDGAIQRAAGGMYHGQLNPENLKDGQVIVAGKSGATKAQFKDVVFVVDDLRQPLKNLVYQGLKNADKAGLKSVNLPAFRTGVMAGAVESKEEAIKATADAIRQFQAENPSNLKDINIVVYRDAGVAQQFERALA